MIGWTLCSGIGAPEMAAPWIDWRLAAEIEAFPRSVLQERFGYVLPEDHNQGDPLLWSDMTEVTPELARAHGIPLPDLIVAGTPCQAFSIAGLRGGTADARGNLTLKFVEICHAIVDARPDGRLRVLWENVPGVLSDSENAFGCFLGGLVGAVDALPPPGDGSWPGEGMVQGPRARAAWCVLDAQHFGVAQRRRRVFVVVDFGGSCDPAQVLLEPESLRGDPPTRGGCRKGAASLSENSARSWYEGKVPEVCGTLSDGAHNGGGLNGQDAYTGRIIPAPDPFVAIAIQERVAQSVLGDISYTLTGEGFDASEDGSGRGTPVVSVAENQRGELRLSDTSPALTIGSGKPGQGYAAALVGPRVRRLMPIECERLQGFPDNHTAVTHKGKPAANGPRYKAIGNSMAVPVIKWILDRLAPSP